MLEALSCAHELSAQLLSEQAWLVPALQQALRAQSRQIAELLDGVLAARGASLLPEVCAA